MNRIKALCLAAAAGTMALSGPAAKADTISVDFVSAVGGLFTYTVSISARWTTPLATYTDGNTVVSNVGVGDVYDNFTIWDFGGFTGLVSNTTGFTFVNPLPGGADYGSTSSGQIADATSTTSGTSPNLVFKNISGPTTFGPGILGTVVLSSSYMSSAEVGYFTSKDSGGTALGGPGPSPSYGGGMLVVPVPLPGAAWAGLALMGVVGTNQIRKRRKEAAC
jgi:hypothetical protein